MFAAGLHGPQMPLLVREQRPRELHQKSAGEAKDGVERSAQLVTHGREKAVLSPIGVLQLQILLLQGTLETLSLSYVADGTADQDALFGVQRAEADFDREFAPVLAESNQVEPASHERVFLAEALRDQYFGRLAEQLRARVTEELLGLGVDEDNLPLLVHDHDGIRRELKQVPEFLLGLCGG